MLELLIKILYLNFCKHALSFNHRESCFKPFPKRQILDSFKLKEFADDNVIFNENGRTISKQIENIVEKGEIARYEQFALFPQCFHKTCTADAYKKQGLFGKGLK